MSRLSILVVIAIGACNSNATSTSKDKRKFPPIVENTVEVPAGWFTMGCSRQVIWGAQLASLEAEEPEGRQSLLQSDARSCVFQDPPRRVWLSSYAIDRFEVTRGDYLHCIRAGACQRLARPSALGRHWYDEGALRRPEEATYEQAVAYCRWRGKTLPSEAQWEKAARGSADERIFPWGDEPPTCDRGLIGGECESSASDRPPVGSFPAGRSAMGVDGMFGDLGEWTSTYGLEIFVPHISAVAGTEDEEFARSFQRERRKGFDVLTYDWKSYKFKWPDGVIDPQGPNKAHPTRFCPTDTSQRVTKGGASQLGQGSVASRGCGGARGYNHTRIASIRCVRSIPGPPAPKVELPADEFTFPFRETDEEKASSGDSPAE